jgi:hypothetical protein
MTRQLKSRFTLSLVLSLLVAGSAFAQERQCEWTNVARVVAVGDVHGDYQQLVKCLLAAGVVDKNNQWIGEKTHLVQTGDIFDRGPDSKKAMDLLMELEPQAEQAGGRVHALIGNHEAMVLAGDYVYLHKTEVEPYGGLEAFKKAVGAEGKYGKWIRGHNAVIKINDILFAHGGISAKDAALPLKEVNRKIAESLGDDSATGAAGDPDGPLWYRATALGDEGQAGELLHSILQKLAIKHIVVGHTVVGPDLRIKARAGGALIMIDVGMSQTYRGGPAMCLVVEGGKFYAVTGTEKTELPVK